MLAELAIGLLLAGSAGERTVPCTEVIQTVAFPYAGSPRYPSQLVLDTVSAPGKHVPQSSETTSAAVDVVQYVGNGRPRRRGTARHRDRAADVAEPRRNRVGERRPPRVPHDPLPALRRRYGRRERLLREVSSFGSRAAASRSGSRSASGRRSSGSGSSAAAPALALALMQRLQPAHAVARAPARTARARRRARRRRRPAGREAALLARRAGHLREHA